MLEPSDELSLDDDLEVDLEDLLAEMSDPGAVEAGGGSEDGEEPGLTLSDSVNDQSGSSAHSVSPPPVHAAGPDPIMPPGVVLATELLRMIVRAAPFEALYSMGLSCRVLRGLVSDELYGEGGREAKVNLESFVLYITPRIARDAHVMPSVDRMRIHFPATTTTRELLLNLPTIHRTTPALGITTLRLAFHHRAHSLATVTNIAPFVNPRRLQVSSTAGGPTTAGELDRSHTGKFKGWTRIENMSFYGPESVPVGRNQLHECVLGKRLTRAGRKKVTRTVSVGDKGEEVLAVVNTLPRLRLLLEGTGRVGKAVVRVSMSSEVSGGG